MNRLIIIGNGFDLAHGLKTSCKHFIINYLSEVWGNLSKGKYEDELLAINRAAKYFNDNDIFFSEDTALSIFEKIRKDSSNNENDAYMIIKSNFFKSIFTKLTNLNWADVETEYFNELYYIVDAANKRINSVKDRISLETDKIRSIQRLNKVLDHLQELLIEYLKKQEADFTKNGEFDKLFLEYFKESIFEGEDSIADSYPEKILFLNFNYTNTLSKYHNGDNVIHIHGELDDNPIFGFGDDTSDKYKELENEYNNEILKKFKSFRYLDNSKYAKLINFINLESFQVQIFGHSCGISDRTLFKQIFEHPNCYYIKIFYHNNEDFEDKIYEISRHFRDKNSFLKKVISFDKLRKMPQPMNY